MPNRVGVTLLLAAGLGLTGLAPGVGSGVGSGSGFGSGVSLGTPARAEAAAPVTLRLMAALRMDETLDVVRVEGLTVGEDLRRDMLPGVSAEVWRARLARIYAADRMQALISSELGAALDGVDLDPVWTFLESPEGQAILASEIATRRSFLDPDVEANAKFEAQNLPVSDPELHDLVSAMILDSDLVERNVAGTLNANMMFLRGLADGGGLERSEADILRDVWAEEETTRDETEAWLRAYLARSYAGTPRPALTAYVELFRTPAGQALNRALFAAFDRLYEEISYLLGQEVAALMGSDPI